MILVDVDNIVKHFGPDPVLAGVSFEIRPGDKIGLVGPNGAGKSTLLRIISGEIEPDVGQAALHAGVRMGYLRQHPHFASGRTVWDEAASALEELTALAAEAESAAAALAEAESDAERVRIGERYERLQYLLTHHDAYNVDHRIERVLTGLGFSTAEFQQDIGVLSGGQQNRLLLAKLLLSEPEVMLLDEPSNHLDIDATEWLENYLAGASAALLIVSHDRYLLDRVSNRTLELHRGTVDSYPGNFSAYWKQKDERLKVQERTYERQQEFIAKTEDFIRRNHYSNAVQAEDRRKKLERLERVAPPRSIESPRMGFPPASRSGDVVIRVEGLAKGFDRPLFSGLRFDVLRGQRWGIFGPNATGKTTLLRCLVGLLQPDDGRVILGHGARMGYYDQMLSGLDPQSTPVEAVRPPHKEMREPQRRELLARFGLIGDQAFQPITSLSGGERSRAALARLAALDANLLVLDEPTNHLDLWARDALERALLAFDGTVIFVSHDRYFLNRVADHLLVVEPGRFRVIEGNYETHQRMVRSGLSGDGRAAKSSAESAAETQAKSDTRPGRAPARKRRFPYRKAAEIEGEILEREARIEALHAELADGAVHRDGARVRAIRDELDQQQTALPPLYEHWEEALELNG